jgi:Fe2+ transport system protein FeoA
MLERAVVYELYEDKKNQAIDDSTVSVMPLAMASAGEKIRIVKFASGRGMCQRLSSMGLNVGSEIEIAKKGFQGPLLIEAGDTRLAIGAGMAHKIIVTPV